MTLTCYGIKNCDTMKKALAWLDEHGIAYTFVDYKKAGVAAAELPGWAARLGADKLANTRGLMWRKIPAEAKENLDDAGWLALLASYPTAIRRPLLVGDDVILQGFDPEEWAARLLGR